MSEPRLEDIGDYNTLRGEKKRVVWAIVIASLIIGSIYTIVDKVYGNVEDKMEMVDPIKNVRIK